MGCERVQSTRSHPISPIFSCLLARAGIISPVMAAQTVTLNGIKVHYQVEGEGPDVLLIHGWASSRRMWTHVLANLSNAYRCWAVDLPGFGESDKPARGWYSIPNYTATMRAFIREAGMERARLIGHSMGGMIVLDLAATHPENVERVIALNPVVTGRRAALRPLAHWGPGPRLLDWTLRLWPRVLQPVLSHPLGESLHGGVRHIRRRAEDFTRGTTDSVWGSGRAVITYDLSPRLAHITAPALVIVGDRDHMVSTAEGRLAAERIPGARLSVLRAGHIVTDDLPGDTLRLVREFFA